MRWLAALFVGVAALVGCAGSVTAPPTSAPGPARSIQHVVILLQENRSFNNLFAGFPGAVSSMTGKCKSASWCPPGGVVTLPTTTLETNRSYSGTDIAHDHKAFEVEYDHGQMDGFDLICIYCESYGGGPPAKLYPYSYVVRRETKPYWDLAEQYTLADHMFFTATASSFVAHQEIIAGTTRISATQSLTDQPNVQPWGCDAPGAERGAEQVAFTPVIDLAGRVNQFGPFPCFTQYKTMADLLDAANVSWAYYVPSETEDFAGTVWNGYDAIEKISCIRRRSIGSGTYRCTRGKDWSHISSPNTTIFNDIKRGTLPSVSWVIPTLAESDHPASGCNIGPKWITNVVNALGTSQYWKNTAIIILWDDWGGWYDPVPPPQINYTSLGFRVPMIVVAPYAKPGYVSHTQYDFGSVLQFVEDNFGLGSLHTSDAAANSMDDVFNYAQTPNTFRPAPEPSVTSCANQNGTSAKEIIERDGGVPE
jgi:phospholipase C